VSKKDFGKVLKVILFSHTKYLDDCFKEYLRWSKLLALLQQIQLNMNFKKKRQKRLAETWQTKEN
jgi:hypothetical protein